MVQVNERIELADQLEALVDRHGLAAVTHALADVAYGKSSHIEVYWQDVVTAGVWEQAGNNIAQTANLVEQSGL